MKIKFVTFVCGLLVGTLVGMSAYPAEAAKRFDDKAFLKLCEAGRLQEVENAIKAGANVNAKDQVGWTALMYAGAQNSNPDVITVLIKNGADVNAADQEEQTPLMHAAAGNSNPEVISTLLKAGANVNAKNKYGATALMQATANNGNPGVTLTLLKMGADPDIEIELDDGKYKALDFAQENDALNNTEVLEMLTAATSSLPEAAKPVTDQPKAAIRLNDEAFIELCMTGTPQEVEDAIRAGSNVNAKNQHGATALIVAAGQNSNPEVITALINAGADVNARDEVLGFTALVVAVGQNNNFEVIATLLKNGADVNARDEITGMTALMVAMAKDNNSEVITALLKNGADVELKNSLGMRAVDFAEHNKNQENINALRRFNARSKGGRGMGIRMGLTPESEPEPLLVIFVCALLILTLVGMEVHQYLRKNADLA